MFQSFKFSAVEIYMHVYEVSAMYVIYLFVISVMEVINETAKANDLGLLLNSFIENYGTQI